MSREVLTRSKTRKYDAFYHEDIQQYKMLPPKGTKRKFKDLPEEPPCEKKFALESDEDKVRDLPHYFHEPMECDESEPMEE